MRKTFPLIIVAFAAVIAIWLTTNRSQDPPSSSSLTAPDPLPIPVTPGPALSSLATTPDWSQIESLQEVVTREEFKDDLEGVFALPGSWESSIIIEADAAWVRHHSGPDSGESKVAFAEEPSPLTPLPPLDQIHIAIDPGHIGGDFAKIEERSFAPFPEEAGQIPVREGDLTLATARHLKPLLEELGATVTLVRETSEPVTELRPEDFLPDFPDRAMAEKLFYRTAEIRARAEKVNQTIRPDLVLCLHYNADAWSDPENPWAPRNHFHLLMHGAYLPSEVALDDQRFEMLRHLFTRSTKRALPLARTLSDVFLRETDLVPYQYLSSAPALPLDDARPIYARNLLANRLYQAPTIFLEPYVMNHRDTYQRVQLGDYDGYQEINGQPRRSLVQEYAHTIQLAFVEYFNSPSP